MQYSSKYSFLKNLKGYPAFGMTMYERSFSGGNYRFGFNGKEKDIEINVDAGDYDFGSRIYDARLGRWLCLDPLSSYFPSISSFQFVSNSPISYQDKDGLINYYAPDGTFLGKHGLSNKKRFVTSDAVADATKFLLAPSTAPAKYFSMLYKMGSHPAYRHADKVAKEWARRYNLSSVNEKTEYKSRLYEVVIDNKIYINYTDIQKTGEYGGVSESGVPSGHKSVGVIHTHSNYSEPSDEDFSEVDKRNCVRNKIDGYLVTPGGNLKKFDFKTGDSKTIDSKIDGDPNSPDYQKKHPESAPKDQKSDQKDKSQ